jgi:WD40 repeat protein
MFSSDTGGDRSYRTFSGHQTDVLYATFSHEGDEVMSCSKDGSVKVFFCITYHLNRSVFTVLHSHWLMFMYK